MILAEIRPSEDDFVSVDWAGIVTSCERAECSLYSTAFHKAAKEADETGNAPARDVFALLGVATSFVMRSGSKSEPFGPLFVFNDSRAPTIGDLTDDQIIVLRLVVPRIPQPELRARIADVVWERTRDHVAASIAVCAYLASASALENPSHWVQSFERINRAMHVAASVRSKEEFDRVVAYVESVLDKYEGDDPLFLSHRLMELLLEFKVGDPGKYGSLADKAATAAEADGDWHRARSYWETKAKWESRAHNDEGRVQALIRIAEAYVCEARDRVQGKGGPASYSVGAHLLQSAIEALRRVPGTDSRRTELHRLLLEWQAKATDELGVVSGTVDLTRLVQTALDAVSGKPFRDAVFALVLIHSPPPPVEIKKQVEQIAQDTPLQFLISSTLLGSDGKVLARRPGMLLGSGEEIRAALTAEMYRHASMQRHIVVVGGVDPARRRIAAEHRPTAHDLLPIVSQNPFVPPGREALFCEGLLAGFDGDFPVAAHLLIPQVENSIRHLLARIGVPTSHLDQNGIQHEMDLNELLYMPELGMVFNENLVFDMKGLLVEAFGGNLRNRIAHGLMDSEELLSSDAVYAWWLILHLCCVPIIVASREVDSAKQEPQ
jgi:hypothetical protein